MLAIFRGTKTARHIPRFKPAARVISVSGLRYDGMNGVAILQPIEPPVLTVELERAAGPYIKGVQKVPMPTYNCYVAELTELAAAVRGGTRLRVTYDEDLMVQEALLRASGGMYS